MNITLTSDLQMRLIKGEVWTLPIYVALCRTDDGRTLEYACPCPAIFGSQFEAMHEFLSPYMLADYGMFWTFAEGTFEKISTVAPGVTPTYHVVWPGHLHDPSKVIELAQQEIMRYDKVEVDISESEDFLRHLVNKTGVMRLADMRIIWSTIQQIGAEWLYREQKPLDLGFTRLIALPYRANWRAYITKEVPGLITIWRMPDAERDAALAAAAFHQNLLKTNLIEFNQKEQTVGWTIDSLPSKTWDDYVRKNELARQQALCTPQRYVSWWGCTLSKLKKNIYESLGNWLEKVSRPIAGLDPGNRASGQRLVAYLSKGRVTTPIHDQPDVAPQSPDVTRQIEGPYAGGHMAAKAAPVREMPVIRFGE